MGCLNCHDSLDTARAELGLPLKGEVVSLITTLELMGITIEERGLAAQLELCGQSCRKWELSLKSVGQISAQMGVSYPLRVCPATLLWWSSGWIGTFL